MVAHEQQTAQAPRVIHPRHRQEQLRLRLRLRLRTGPANKTTRHGEEESVGSRMYNVPWDCGVRCRVADRRWASGVWRG